MSRVNRLSVLITAVIFASTYISLPASAGTLEFDGVPVDLTTAEDEDLTIVPGTGGNVQIGDLAGVNSYATSNDDLFVAGVTEVNGAFYADGGIYASDLSKIKDISYSWPSLQGAAGTVLRNDGNGNLTWVVGGGGASLPVMDTTSIVEDDADDTKEMRFELSGLLTGTTRVLTVPDADGTLAVSATAPLTLSATGDLSLGDVPVSLLNGGTNASNTTFWRGDGTWATPPTSAGDITAVGSMTSGDAFSGAAASGQWLGLGPAAGRIEFDDQATDEVNIMDARVGIGTSTPSSLSTLDVNGTGLFGDTMVGGNRLSLAALGNSGHLGINGWTSGYGVDLNANTGSVTVTSVNNGLILDASTASAANTIKFQMNSTDKMVLDHSGNLGIGMTAPGARLQVTPDVLIGDDIAAGTPNVAGTLKMVSAGDNAFTTSFTIGTQTESVPYVLPLAQALSAGQVLTNDGTGILSWSDVPASGDSMTVNGADATDLNFSSTVATGTNPSIAWLLNTVSDPDDLTLGVGAASDTEAGVVTTGAQTFAGTKTFSSQITASSGVSTSSISTAAGNITVQPAGAATTANVVIGAANGGAGSANPDLLVLDKASAASPAAVDGALLLDSTGKLNISEAGQWKVLCNKTDADCGAGSGSALSAILNATGANSISNGDNAQAWNWALTNDAKSGFAFSESAAATNGTGTQYILETGTAAGSTAGPFKITSNSADVGDVMFDLASAGDFVVADNGTPFASFNDDGTIAFTSLNMAEALTFEEMGTPPATSGAGAGRIYFDDTDNKFKVSENDGAYVDLIGSVSPAPVGATYITQTPDGILSGEQALSALTTGLLKNTTVTGVLSVAGEGTDYYAPGGTDVALADGGTGASLTDPNTNRLMGWDDTDNEVRMMVIGTGLSYDAASDTLTASDLGGDVVGPASATDNAVTRYDLTTGKLIQNSGVVIDDTDNVSGAASVTLNDGGGLRTTSVNTDTALLQAYDVDGASYTTLAILTAGNVPTMDLDDSVTKAGQYIYRSGGTDVALADGGTGASLSDPGGDRLMFWDDSVGATAYLELGSTLSISDTTLNANFVSPRLDQIQAATNTNTIANGLYPQTWNWALAGTGGTGMTFGETTAAAGTGIVLKAATLASSTATPLVIDNFGDGNSLFVNDVSGDTSPFVIEADGDVGIGTTAPAARFEIQAADGSNFTDYIAKIRNLDVTSGEGHGLLVEGAASSSDDLLSIRKNDDVNTYMFRVKGNSAVSIGATTSSTPDSLSIYNDESGEVPWMILTRSGVVAHEIRSQNSGPDLIFSNNASGDYLFSTGNIGVGTTGPSNKLEVVGTVASGDSAGGTAGSFKLYDADGANPENITLNAPAIADGDSYSLTLPVAQASGTQVLRNDGSGVLSWATTATGAPTDATYITQTPDGTLSDEQALSVLATGLLKNTTTTGILSVAGEGTDYYAPGGTDVSLADGGTGASLADPNADRLMGWDDTDNEVRMMVIGTGLSYDAASDTLTASGSGGNVVGPASATDNAIARFDFTTGKLIQNSDVLIDDTNNVSGAASITLNSGGALRTSTVDTNTALLQAYDVDGASYTTFGTLTAGNIPTLDISDSVTKAGQYIYRFGGTDVSLADGGTGASLADPNADRIFFWNDTAGLTEFLSVGSNLSISAGTLNATSAPTDATYITQTPDGTLSGEQALNALSTGLMQVTTTTGVVSSVTTSAGVAGLISDEIGSAGGGVMVFSKSPIIETPVIKGEAVVALTPGASISTNASLGNIFTIVYNSDATLDIPTNPTNGQKCIWRFKNTDASAHSVTLTVAGAGSFRFGSTIAGLSATPAGKTDYIGAVYNLTDDKWDVIAYAKGYV